MGAARERGGARSRKWKVENGYIEIVPRTGRLITKEKFGDCQLHVEWMVPEGDRARARAAGTAAWN